jgi:hypothetical protein
LARIKSWWVGDNVSGQTNGEYPVKVVSLVQSGLGYFILEKPPQRPALT